MCGMTSTYPSFCLFCQYDFVFSQKILIMKPSEVIDLIREGNEGFLQGKNTEFFKTHSKKQCPMITMLTCSDARVQSSVILPEPVNNIFCIENIGNQVSNAEGSLDYGILHLETPVLLILGHSDCGAIKAYTAGYDQEPASIQRELNNLQPAFVNIHDEIDLLGRIRKNIDYQVRVTLSKYSEKVRQEKLAILGAYYDFANDMGAGYGKLHILSINGKTV